MLLAFLAGPLARWSWDGITKNRYLNTAFGYRMNDPNDLFFVN
jgi:hypothetical protein